MKPILFNTEMVKTILDGRKTVTRRIIKLKYDNTHHEMFTNKYGTRLIEIQNDVEGETFGKNPDGSSWRKLRGFIEPKPPYKAGDILYVRETWRCYRYDNMDGNLPFGVQYKADGEKNYFEMEDNERYERFEKLAIKDTWKPSLFMPKEAARIFLRVTDVRLEKLSDMTVKDMISEGINMDGLITSSGIIEYRVINRWEELWDSTVKKSELIKYGRDANPWVWVIEFERCEKPKEDQPMSDDLISRLAVKIAFHKDKRTTYTLEDVSEIIDSLPTSYDVGKIAKELFEGLDSILYERCYSPDYQLGMSAIQELLDKIVKGGGQG